MSKRFKFGKNWKKYIERIDENRIKQAQSCLLKPLNKSTLEGLSFIDIGSGSGLMSLVAMRAGAKVLSFDYDKDSVEATSAVRKKFEQDNPAWSIEEGSVLDVDYLSAKGTFDIVYSWGVLHHTGNLLQAMSNIIPLVKDNGFLYLAVYNNQGLTSKLWRIVKKTYNLNLIGMVLISILFIPYFYITGILFDLLRKGNPFYSIMNYNSNRGMSYYYDIIDWIGGYPFEVATHSDIFNFYKERGFSLQYLHSTTSMGCNEYVFVKNKIG